MQGNLCDTPALLLEATLAVSEEDSLCGGRKFHLSPSLLIQSVIQSFNQYLRRTY